RRHRQGRGRAESQGQRDHRRGEEGRHAGQAVEAVARQARRRPARLMSFDFWAVLAEWPLRLEGVAWTLGLTAIATVLGMAVGVACGWVRAWGPAGLRWIVGAYVELIRNTPFIVQLFFIFFGLPAAGVKLTPE